MGKSRVYHRLPNRVMMNSIGLDEIKHVVIRSRNGKENVTIVRIQVKKKTNLGNSVLDLI